MASSDAIVVGEGWLSEHYFTTDAKSQSFQSRIIERRKQWDETEANGHQTVRTRFAKLRPSIESRLALLVSGSDDHSVVTDVYEPLTMSRSTGPGGAA